MRKNSRCEKVFYRCQNGGMSCTRTHGPGHADAANVVRARCSLGDQIEEICVRSKAGALLRASIEGRQLNGYAARSQKMYSVIRQ